MSRLYTKYTKLDRQTERQTDMGDNKEHLRKNHGFKMDVLRRNCKAHVVMNYYNGYVTIHNPLSSLSDRSQCVKIMQCSKMHYNQYLFRITNTQL